MGLMPLYARDHPAIDRLSASGSIYLPFFACGTFLSAGLALFAAGDALRALLAKIAEAASLETPSFFAMDDAALANPGCFLLFAMVAYFTFFAWCVV